MDHQHFCKKLTDRIRQHLEEDLGTDHFQQSNGIFSFQESLSGLLRIIEVNIIVDPDGFEVLAKLPVGCNLKNGEHWDGVQRFLNWINLYIPHGHFQLHPRNGTVYFRDHCHCQNPSPTYSEIFQSIAYVVSTCQEHGDNILRRMFRQKPREAENISPDLSELLLLIEEMVNQLEVEIEEEAEIDYDAICKKYNDIDEDF